MCFTDSAPYTKKRHNNCVWGGSQIGGRQKCLHLLKHQRLSATIVVCQTKEIIFCRSKSCYFCWSNYVLFQGITSLKVLYINNSENVWNGSQTVGLVFHKLHRSRISTKMYLNGVKACFAQAFATVLAVHSEISEEQRLKRIPELVRNRTVLIRLGSDNSCPTIGL